MEGAITIRNQSSNVKLPQKYDGWFPLAPHFISPKRVDHRHLRYILVFTMYLGLPWYLKKKDHLAKRLANLTATEVWKSLTTTRWFGGRFLKPSSRRAEGTAACLPQKCLLQKCRFHATFYKKATFQKQSLRCSSAERKCSAFSMAHWSLLPLVLTCQRI